MRVPPFLLGAVVALSAGLSAGCPADLDPPGDVSFGQYRVTATLGEDGCSLEADREEDGAFDFRARLAADYDGVTAWLSVAQPPDAVLQRPRAGAVEDGGARLVFPTTVTEDLSASCGCHVQITEQMIFSLQVREDVEEEEDDPVNGSGNDDGNGNGDPNGNGGPDDDDPEPPPIDGLPHPDDVASVTGRLHYELRDPGGCPSIENGGCPLPCDFEYVLEGPRVDGS